MTDETLKNIVIEVKQEKLGLEWLERQRALLNPTQRKTDPAPSIYVQAIEKFAMVKACSVNVAPML